MWFNHTCDVSFCFALPPLSFPPHGCRSEVLTLNQRLVAGMFTLQPAFGTILPGQVQRIVVEFTADTLGKFGEVRPTTTTTTCMSTYIL